MGIRQWVYHHLVTNNDNIRAEYEGNNIQYPEQHRKHKVRSWLWLLGLNIKYKMLKISPNKLNETVKYIDRPVERIVEKKTEKVVEKEIIKKYISNAYLGSESKRISTWKEVHLVKRFLGYDYCVFPVWDVLIYMSVDTQDAFYNLIGLRLGISFFSSIRNRAEEEATVLYRRMEKKERPNLFVIYSVVEKYTGIKAEAGIQAELLVLKEVTVSNPYMIDFLQMLSYNRTGLIAIADTVYSSEQIMNLLCEKGYSFFEEVIVGSEKTWEFDTVDFYSELVSEYGTDSIIYMDRKENTNTAKKAGISVWEYYSPNDLGNQYRAKGLPYYSGALYRSIINQHMYCGHYNHSEKRELGYIYFGIFALGFTEWVKNVCKEEKVEKIFLVSGSDSVFLPILSDGLDMQVDSVLFSEEFAVRYLVSEDAFSFFEYYVDRKCSKERPVSYYLDLMDIPQMSRQLSVYGISTTDMLVKNNETYRCFLDFVLENKDKIFDSYRNDFKAAYEYISSLEPPTGKAVLVSMRDKGYRGKAFLKILKDVFGYSESLLVLTAIQNIGSHEAAYQSGLLRTYLYSEQNDYYGLRWPVDNLNSRYMESVFAECRPEFRLFYKDGEDYGFEFKDADPTQYDKVREIQRGIADFIRDYKFRIEDTMFPKKIDASLVGSVTANILLQPDYIKRNIPLIRE